MKTLTIQVTLCSHALIGSGEGFGAVIDSDVVFDELGIPYIPAKRIKGCLRDAAEDASMMVNASNLNIPCDIEKTFGVKPLKHKPVRLVPGAVYFSNLKVEQYAQNYEWLDYLVSSDEYSLLSKDAVIKTFTALRQQTKIDDGSGIAHDGSLRTSRVLKKGNAFYGTVTIMEDDDTILSTLALACANLRHIGTKRNRGFGEIDCRLLNEQQQEIHVV